MLQITTQEQNHNVRSHELSCIHNKQSVKLRQNCVKTAALREKISIKKEMTRQGFQ